MEAEPQKNIINNKYIISKKLSYGGQANIFLVKEIDTNKKYVAKIPKINNDLFLVSEVEILKSLNKKNIPNIINYVEDGKTKGKKPGAVEVSYAILEYAQNRDLEQYVKFPGSGFGEKLSKVIFYRIAKIIYDIHESETCHRDIKLDNILLDENYHPKLSDFGLAIHYSNNLQGYTGTPRYMAPEITKDGKYDGKEVDIFSLGVTLFRLTLGIFPYTDSNNENILYYLFKNKKYDLYWKYIDILENNSEEINNLSDEFKKLFYQMVSFDPSERPDMEKILYDNWFGDIKDMSESELNDYEKEIKLEEEFKKRAKIIKDCLSSNCEKKNEGIYYNTKSFEDEKIKEYFEYDIKPKLIEKEKYMNYLINIKGYINPKKFLNYLCYIIAKKEDGIIYINKIGKAEFDVEFEKEEKEFIIPEELKAEFEKLKIKMDEKKEKNENDKKNLIIRIKLYQTSEGYLLRFVKKQGEKGDFIDKFVAISNLVKELI